MSKKKNYNPFKMWGSWVGGFINLILLFLLIPQTILGKIGFDQIIVVPMIDSWSYVWITPTVGVVGIILTTVLGFLIGWGIHSLIRKLSR